MRYYSGTVSRKQMESLDQWEKELKNIDSKCQILHRGYCKENYYIIISATKKPNIGKFTWLKSNEKIQDIEAIWYKPGNDGMLGQLWIVQYNDRQYSIEYNNRGCQTSWKEFKTENEAVNWLRTEGYLKDRKKEWIA